MCSICSIARALRGRLQCEGRPRAKLAPGCNLAQRCSTRRMRTSINSGMLCVPCSLFPSANNEQSEDGHARGRYEAVHGTHLMSSTRSAAGCMYATWSCTPMSSFCVLLSSSMIVPISLLSLAMISSLSIPRCASCTRRGKHSGW